MLRLEQIRAGRRQTHAAALTQTLIPPDTKPFQTWKKENDCKLKMERNEKIFQINRNSGKLAFKVSKIICFSASRWFLLLWSTNSWVVQGSLSLQA